MFGWKQPPVSEEHFRKWTQTRSRGETYFVLTKGGVFALILGVISSALVVVWYEHKRFDGLWEHIIRNGIGWIIGGIFAGISEWKSNEKRYSRELKEFSLLNYETPEQTLKNLQRGIENGR